MWRRGICDGSAGVALTGGYFIVANDESNILSVYQSDTGSVPVDRVRLSAALGIGRPNREADIEGATTLGDTAYWITSHANAKDGERLADRHRLFATVESRNGSTPSVRPVGRLYSRLVTALLADTALARYGIATAATRSPEESGGLNIEGLAATPDGRLLIGFRSPVPEGRALIVPIENPSGVIFRDQEPRLGRATTVALGGRGIRSIEYVPAMRAYAIAAANDDGRRRFALYRWSGAAADAPRPLEGATLEGGLSPEAIVVEREHPERLLILSDDSGRRLGGRECKDADDSRKFFRSVTVAVPR
ncbi:MAG TPA: DUF3616 domain-containing protein [Gemmatimonadaceae bacterium]|nr:DUF3616 domain-containing protein [Gemmatimonadaceae bacterium]